MLSQKYNVETSPNFTAFDFFSEGKNGRILKGVRYTKTEIENLWNLGFGDVNESTKDIDDLVVTDNGDSEIVLATVANTCIIFTDKFINAKIIAIGSTKSRTRLYQININSNYPEISELFYLWGMFNNSWEAFEKGKNYEAFLIKRKR